MRVFLKEKFNLLFIGLIIMVVSICGTVTASIVMSARDISFTSTNANFKANNVEDAMNELYGEAQKEQIYSEEEKVIGTWIDGKPIYRITIRQSLQIESNTWTATNYSASNISKIIHSYAIGSAGAAFSISSAPDISNTINVMTHRNGSIAVDYLIFEYTKTTD